VKKKKKGKGKAAMPTAEGCKNLGSHAGSGKKGY
jgi:hypothetical protein